MGAINEVLTSVNTVQSQNHFALQIVGDLRLLDALRTKFAVPFYLLKITQSCL